MKLNGKCGVHMGNPSREKRTEQKSLQIAIGVTAGIMAVEIFGGIISGSLALLSDASWTRGSPSSRLRRR